MNMKNNKGFSLVELIVVIAIMAVLAAVAVIGVSIYIPKAQEAADTELRNVLGDALRTACLSEGVDPSSITATIAVDTEGKLAAKADGTVNLVISGTSKQDKLLELFNQIFTEKNAVTKQPKGNQLKFDGKTFVWNDGTTDPNKYAYGDGGYLTLAPEDIEKLKDSTFGEMGMQNLMTQMDQVTNIAVGLSNVDAYKNVYESEDFLRFAAKSVGINPDTDADWQNKLNQKLYDLSTEYLDNNGMERTDANRQKAIDKITANAVVLYTAQHTATLKPEELDGLLNTSDSETIMGNMLSNDKSGDGIAQAALMCGLYTGYVNSDMFPEGKSKDVTTAAVLAALDDPGFKTYRESEQGKKDLQAYLSSMNILTDSSGDMAAVEALMLNGYADPELIKILNQSLGK